MIVLISLLFLVSCSQVTLDYHMPTTGGYTPEVSGEFISGHLSGKLHADQKVEFGDAFSTDLFSSSDDVTVRSEPIATSSFGFGFGGAIGVHERIEIGLRTSAEAPTIISTNIQLLGGSVKTRDLGHKMSIALGYGFGEDEESNFKLEDENSSSSQNDLSGLTETENFEVGLQYGFRKTETVLLYSSLYHTQYKAEGTITSDQDKEFKFKNESNLTSLNVGLVSHSKKKSGLRVQAEVGYAFSKIKGASNDSHDQANVLLAFGFHFQ